MNRLANEKSAYLKHAASQPIDWHPWSDEAFDRARREDKPVFLSIGAVWCHWCHVMARESFDDESIARILNDRFISVKLDRDEHPDIDRRYQQAVAAMGAGGGWPLSVFLTPDREPFYGGTYFPPTDLQGRPGFKKVLASVADFYGTQRHDAVAFSAKVMDSLKPEPLEPSRVSEAMIGEAESSILSLVDPSNGGFGTAPKFPMPGALEFLIRRSPASSDPDLAEAAKKMLDAMAAGGFHDHLGGGFHRYSVDEAWTVPHFEKMADDNAGLLRNYVDGCAVFGDERYRDVAMDIIGFTREVLSDPAGGFYGSQDADVTPDDEGGYFTWTAEEFRNTLEPGEYALLSAHLLHEEGSMRHAPDKKVLFTKRPAGELARSLGINAGEARRIIGDGRKKLLTARGKRTAPFIDRTLYTSLNGMLISSLFHAYCVLGNDEVKAFAVKSLDRILRERFTGGRLLHAEEVPAGLDDYIHLIDALLAGYEATADRTYLARADELMTLCREKFHDAAAGGFFDTDRDVLGTRMKRVEDIPQPSANALAILLLLKLSHMTEKDEYRRMAVQSLELFSGLARETGVHAGAYFCGLDASFRMVKLTVEAHPESVLAKAARALAGTLHTAIVYGSDLGRVIPCRDTVCHEPVSDPSLLVTVCAKL